MKIKVIDLLEMIANNEQPNHIIFNTEDWYWGYDSYVPKSFLKMSPDVQVSSSLFQRYRIDYCLNDEVEIIEDNKKEISKDIKWYLIDFQEEEKTKIAQINMNFKLLREKLREIIDFINNIKGE